MNKTYPSDQPHTLTRSLGFNAYHLLTANSVEELQASANYLNEKYDSVFLVNLLEEAAGLIGAKVLNVSSEKYEPLGTSVALLLAEATHTLASLKIPGNTLLGHLDKSHLTVHTYPQVHPDTGLASLRLDFDLATCGIVSPLETLSLLFAGITCDAVLMDFRVRGDQLSSTGKMEFGSNEVNSISDYLPETVRSKYHIKDSNIPEVQIYHTRMIRRILNPSDHMLRSDDQVKLSGLDNLEKHLTLLYKG